MFNTEEEVYYSVILMCIFALLLITVIIITAILYYNRKKQHQQERARYQKELLHTQLEIQEQTLKNISQEIHDNIGQTLSLARLTLNMMDVENDLSFDRVHHSQHLVGKAIQDLRSLSKTLNTDAILEAGLMNAIAFELELLEKAGAYKTELIVTGTPQTVDAQKELILFRIVQEALNNTIKHAGANAIKILFHFDGDRLALVIQDNGQGFQIAHTAERMDSGSGLRNMRNRAEMIGGTFHVESSSITGTQIRITIPTSHS